MLSVAPVLNNLMTFEYSFCKAGIVVDRQLEALRTTFCCEMYRLSAVSLDISLRFPHTAAACDNATQLVHTQVFFTAVEF